MSYIPLVFSNTRYSSGDRATELMIAKSRNLGDFPGGTVVKNPPANVGNVGSIPGPGRSHMPWSN